MGLGCVIVPCSRTTTIIATLQHPNRHSPAPLTQLSNTMTLVGASAGCDGRGLRNCALQSHHDGGCHDRRSSKGDHQHHHTLELTARDASLYCGVHQSESCNEKGLSIIIIIIITVINTSILSQPCKHDATI
jgi:hypothetical protein